MQSQRHPRREEDVDTLPPLTENTRAPPRSLRFKEAPQGERRTSKLPELRRRESIISTYRSELYQPKIVTFMKNGDRFFEGVKVNVSSRNFRHWEVLLSELSRSIDLPAGVRNIYTPESGHRVTNLDQFQHQKAYVCASTEPFKKIAYGKAKTPTWCGGTKVKHKTCTLLDLSKSIQGLDRAPTSQNQTVDRFVLQQVDERKRRDGNVRKQSNCATQLPVSLQEGMILSPLRKIALPPPSEPSQFTIICDGPPPRKVVTILLDRQCILSWEQARSIISESVQSTNGCLQLYSVDGMEIDSLSQLWSSNKVLISTGNGDFNIANFLQGNNHPTERNAQTDQHMLAEDVTVTNSQEESVSSPQWSAFLQKDTEQQGEIRSMIGEEEREREGKGERDEEDGKQEGENEVEGEWQEETKDVLHTESDVPLQSSTVPTPQMQNSPLEARDTFQEQHTGEQHPSSRAEPEESVAYPTNSMLTLDSFVSAGSPLTVAKVAAIQHLHALAEESALPYNVDHISTLSEGSTYMNLTSASRTSVICPQTPQSDLSFNSQPSLVEMIVPREMSDISTSTTSTQPKSRTVGIQTDLIGDKLSAVIEEDQQPSGMGTHQKKRRLTHPLFHTRISVTSQVTSSGKDNYTLGAVLAKGRFAVVQECHHKLTGRQYSLRVINKACIFGQDDLIWRECKVLRCMKHENLVQMVDGWETSDDICMVVEHVEGTDLFDAVLHCQHFSEVDANCAMKQLSMALVYLHAHKIVHRDIKLENIFLHHVGDGEWTLKLGGMGLATNVFEPLSLICGITYYMAPEMITETGYGTKLDVWAAGVICCTLLSGIMPFGSNSKRATISNIKRGKYAFLSPFWDEVSEEAKDFVRHLLVVSPHKRYMATQMLQHPWIQRERWEPSEKDSELGRMLTEYLVSKSSSTKNAALSTLIVTALDKRNVLLEVEGSLHRNTHTQKNRS